MKLFVEETDTLNHVTLVWTSDSSLIEPPLTQQEG